MKNGSHHSAVSDSARPERIQQWRIRKDNIARTLIGLGGISVIFTVVLLFLYLVWAVLPLFLPAQTTFQAISVMPDWREDRSVFLSIESQRKIGLRISSRGRGEFFRVNDGSTIDRFDLPLAASAQILFAREAQEGNGLVALALDSGDVLIFRHQYGMHSNGESETAKMVPVIDFPYTPNPLFRMPNGDISRLVYSDGEDGLILAAAAMNGLVRIKRAVKVLDEKSGELTLQSHQDEIGPEFNITGMAVSGNHRWLYLGDDQGWIRCYGLPDLKVEQELRINDHPITSMAMLLGGISLLTGDNAGNVSQSFPVSGPGNEFSLQLIRQFEPLDSPVVSIIPEQRRKGFLALSADHELAIFNSTSGRLIHRQSLTDRLPGTVALSPRADSLLIASGDGDLGILNISNPHPEISFSTLWRKVWYENEAEVRHVWQSSAIDKESEVGFSLTPLIFGTVKAAICAMLFAIPLALMSAAYTAYFMSPVLRGWVKPGIELMAALPMVIIAFVAGIWLAPFLEKHLAGIFMIALLVPGGLLLSAWLWKQVEERTQTGIFAGWEPLVQIPVVLVLVITALSIAGPVQDLFFDGDLNAWLNRVAGISYEQRNAVIVGCAMGFAVMPAIFSIAEDAISGVPASLSRGSLALGATPWQTLVRVVIPSASAGIFSALMIGFGRAVGETMIVLIASGNTAIMEWNLFEGMRTLTTSMALEMPDSEASGSHYRVLFLAALILFMFTFVLNTGAEFLRQRLRDKYSSL
jgi:phosphate transport system permease protein